MSVYKVITMGPKEIMLVKMLSRYRVKGHGTSKAEAGWHLKAENSDIG